MSRTIDFTKPVQRLSTEGRVIGVNWWVPILHRISNHPGRTSRECRYAICPAIWGKGIIKIVPVRKGRTFVYYCTPRGSYFIGNVMESLYRRGY